MARPSATSEDHRPLWALLAVVLAGTVLRMGSAAGDLWVDEIWSLDQIEIARASGSARDWIALFLHDNTHALNTLYLLAVGPDAPMIVYRLFAFASGMGAILAAAAIGWRRHPWEGVLLAVLVAISYPMVHFSGEARGYGPMLFAGFAAFGLLDAFLRRPSFVTGAGFAAAALFGLLSHLTFGAFLAGLGIWGLMDMHRRGTGTVSAVARLVPLFGPAFLASAAYGALAVNNFVIGGVTFVPAAEAVGTLSAYTLGLPTGIDPALTAAGVGCLAAAGVLFRVARGDRAWPAFAVIVVLFPLGGVLAETEPYVLPRYFLAAAPAALILLARCIADLWRLGPVARTGLAAALAIFSIGNALSMEKFFMHGRGAYADAVRAIATDPATVRIAGYPDFSVRTMFRYHASRLNLTDRLRYVNTAAARRTPPEWLILGYRAGARAAPSVKRAAGTAPSVLYRRHATFPHWGLSGDTWTLYRRQ